MEWQQYCFQFALLRCVLSLLGVKVLFVKNGKFPSGHIHDNPAMRKHNIECARHEEMKNLN